jgi:hypothetical protein
VKKWEKIILALDAPERHARAKAMFELMEEERRIAVSLFSSYAMQTAIKLAKHKYAERIKDKVPDDTKFRISQATEAIEKEDQEAERKAIAEREKENEGS